MVQVRCLPSTVHSPGTLISQKYMVETVSVADLLRGLMRVLVESVRARESTLVFLLQLWSSLLSRDVHLDTQYATL